VTAHASGRLQAVVAIPARDEEERLPACLAALAAQTGFDGRRLPPRLYAVLLFLNNCVDASHAAAEKFRASFGPRLRIVSQLLPPGSSHAGGARRAAMDMAADWLRTEAGIDGLLLTTDADSRVGPTWIADNLAAIGRGADAVAGEISLDAEDEARLPEALRRRGLNESTYERQLIEIAAYLDPEDHNPWPHHGTASGASLGVTQSAYRRIGGLPIRPLGEDKALVQKLRRCDARIRFEPRIRVVTSGRLIGRADGGVADTMRLRCENPTTACDAFLEPLPTAFMRSYWRGQSRAALRRYNKSSGEMICFGEIWERLEPIKLPLSAPLKPGDLGEHIQQADRALERLRALGAPGEVDAEAVKSLAPDILDDPAHALQQQLARFVATQRIIGRARPVDQQQVAAGRQRAFDAVAQPTDIGRA
jgi:hypothetical protein